MNVGTSDGVETTFHHKEILPGKFTLVFLCGSFPKEIIPYTKINMLIERVSAIRLIYHGRALRAMSVLEGFLVQSTIRVETNMGSKNVQLVHCRSTIFDIHSHSIATLLPTLQTSKIIQNIV